MNNVDKTLQSVTTNEALQHFINKYAQRERIETAASYNIVDYLNFLNTDTTIDLVLDAFTYEADETAWNVKLNQYVKTGGVIEKAAVIVHNVAKKNDYLIYLPLSCVEMIKELRPLLKEVSGIRIILSTFSKDEKKIGFVAGFETV